MPSTTGYDLFFFIIIFLRFSLHHQGTILSLIIQKSNTEPINFFI